MCEQAQSYKRKGADATSGHMTQSETDSTLHAGLLNESRRTRCGILSTLAANGYLHHSIELGIAPTVRLHRLMVLSCAAELLGDGLDIFCGQAILGLVRQKTIQDRGQLRQGCELDIFRLHTVIVDDVLIQDIIGKLRRKNIEVLAAGIGEDRERVKEIYGNDNYIDISDLSALPKTLTNIVRKKVYAAM